MPYLAVPMEVQALVISRQAQVPCLGPLHSFRRLPGRASSGGKRRPYISADLAQGAKPFGKTYTLAPGIHLHWRLPAALCHGVEKDGKLGFPLVPNRWLVTRLRMDGADSKTVRAYDHWIVESDYLGLESDGNPRGFPHPTVPLAATDHRGWRRIGRQMRLDAWLAASAADPVERLPHGLTAQGYGDPSFAAYYPSSASVFGFFDPADDLDHASGGAGPAHLGYHVTGWYESSAADPLGQAPFRDILLGAWIGTDRKKAPDQTLCHGGRGGLEWGGGASLSASAQPGLWDRVSGELALSPQEALAAGLAHHFNQPNIGPTLNFLQFSASDGADATQQRHQARFRHFDGGRHWVLKRTDGTAPPKGQSLPKALATALGTLNAEQRLLDRLDRTLMSQRRQLFGDWFKSLMILYSHDIPDHFRQDAEAVAILLDQSCGAIGGTIKARETCATRVEALKTALTTQATQHKLVEAPEPRFWRPLDPVLCVVGQSAGPAPKAPQPRTCRRGETISAAPVGIFPAGTSKEGQPPWAMLAGLIAEFALEVRAAATAGWAPLFLHYEANFGTDKEPLRRYRGASRMIPADGASFPPVLAGMETRLDNELKALPKDGGEQAKKLEERRAAITGSLEKIRRFREAVRDLPPIYLPGLNGLYDNFLMLDSVLQMRIEDPYASGPRRDELRNVQTAVGRETVLSPLPRLPFRPWSEGTLSLSRLRLADVFGRFKDYPTRDDIVPALQMPGRLAQAARLQFRWAPRGKDAVTPVVAWILVNFVDDCFEVFDGNGIRLGALGQVARNGKVVAANWKPDADAPAPASAALRDFIGSLKTTTGDAPAARARLIEAIERKLLATSATAAGGTGLAPLLGRPLAVVEASLSLELMGEAAASQSWDAFTERLDSASAPSPSPTPGIAKSIAVELNGSGLVGLWAPKKDAPATVDFTAITLAAPRPTDGEKLELTVGDNSRLPLTLLVDPFRTVQAVSQILPVKTIRLPDYLWEGSASAMTLAAEIFPLLAGPIDGGRIRLVEPASHGGAWEWVGPGADGKTPLAVADIGNGEDSYTFSPMTLVDGRLRRKPSSAS